MSVTIKGYAGNLVFSKGDFKIYGFLPNNESVGRVVLSSYGNITIKGELPKLIQGREYEIEVEYEKKGKYESYNVIKIITNLSSMTQKETELFIESMVGEKVASNILSVYPNFLELMMNEEYDKIDLSKINGIKAKKFEKIKEKINENFKFLNIMAYFKEYNLTMSQVRKLHESYSSFEMLKNKMEENPYRCLCSIAGIGFKTADVKILSNNTQLLTSKFRMEECILHVLKQQEEMGNTWTSVNMLYREAANVTPECISMFNNVLEKSNYIYKLDEKVSSIEVYNCEKEISNRLNNMLNNNFSWEIDTANYSKANGFDLTDQQKEILEIVKDNNVSVLSGFAGSGKTMSSIALTDMLKDNGLSYLLLAPTGKASKVLSGYTGEDAKTIHRGLECKGSTFEYNEKRKLKCHCVIVDEASMIDIFLMRSLLRAIDPLTTKLVFICDPAQIPSVGCGNCIQDIINSDVIPVARLDKVFRYKDGGLAKVATQTRNGEMFLSCDVETNQQVFGTNKDFIFIQKSKETMKDEVLRVYKKLISSGICKDDIVVVSAYNKGELGTYSINAAIQDMVNPYNGSQLSYTKDNSDIKFRIGDRVIQTKNNYKVLTYDDEDVEVDIFNGDEGYVVDIKGNLLIVDFDGVRIGYDNESIRELLLAYSISIHKSQGSQYKHVIVVTPSSHAYFLNRNLLYVGYTRAKEKVYNIGDVKTIKSALKKSDNLLRRTNLKEFLK